MKETAALAPWGQQREGGAGETEEDGVTIDDIVGYSVRLLRLLCVRNWYPFVLLYGTKEGIVRS